MGILSSLAGSIIGNVAASGDQDADTAARQAALQGILNVQAPSIAEQTVNPALESVQGTYDPSMEGTVGLGPSAMGGITTDPRLMQAQMSALQDLQQRGQGGLTATDRMNLMNITNQTEGNANAASNAIMQNMAARGMGGGGAELSARLMAAQGAANRGAQNGMSIASQAQQNALQALAQSGALGGQMQAQQFGEKAQQAQAQDVISKFNAANQQQVLGTNTTAGNQAKLTNLANAQNVANTNVGTQNQAQYHNKGLYQQQFGNQMQQAGAAAGQYNKNANYYGQQAAGTRGMWAGIGDQVGQMTTGGDFKNAMGGLPFIGGSSSSGSNSTSFGDPDFSGVGGSKGVANGADAGGGGGGGGGSSDALGGLMSLAALA